MHSFSFQLFAFLVGPGANLDSNVVNIEQLFMISFGLFLSFAYDPSSSLSDIS